MPPWINPAVSARSETAGFFLYRNEKCAAIQYYRWRGVIKNVKVLLLGATGLLGHNVLRHLVSAGHDVTVLVRRADGVKIPQGGWRTVTGSPLDRSVLLAAAKGCDAVINCAGATDMSLPRLDDYLSANRDIPALVVSVMEELGIRILVHTSTVNTIGHGSADCPADESAPMRPPFTKSLYAQSKLAGEEVVLQAAARHPDWHAIIINPGFMIGPWDVKPSSGRLLDAAYGRRLMVAPRGGKSFVDVDDVAKAEVAALTKGENGQRYILAYANMSTADLYRMQARTMGYGQRLIKLPTCIALLAGMVGNVLRWCGIRSELSVNNVRQLYVKEYYDGSRACREFGLVYSALEDAIKDYHIWKRQSRK